MMNGTRKDDYSDETNSRMEYAQFFDEKIIL